MPRASWFSEPFRRKVKETVVAIEAQTSAEVVVAVRPVSTSTRHVDFGVGLGVALAVLCVFLYAPQPFDFTFLPLELAASFGFGVVLSASLPALRRALGSRRAQCEGAAMAARAAFVDFGVHRTRGRTGILVLVAVFERRAEVVADVGVPLEAIGAPFASWRERLDAAVRRGPDELCAVLAELGPILRDALPRADDDVNELADGLAEVAA